MNAITVEVLDAAKQPVDGAAVKLAPVSIDDLLGRSARELDLTAVHLDQAQPGYDGRPLADWLANFGAPYQILREDTYSVVLDHTPPGGTYCAVCSRLRRGILYTAAERLGCNKIALGHHRDDALETLLLNLFYGGKLQAMPAAYTTDDGRFQVIRPLIECAEADIAEHAREAGYPILPCNLCGSQDGLRRDAMARLLESLERESPNVRAVMLSAIKNVSATHLLDPRLLTAKLDEAKGPVKVNMPGGTLNIEVAKDFSLTMKGPVAEVARGSLSPSFVRGLR